ncbi:uncharacterized protein [Solanum lycopersicum]|uniref:uncharacterized protein n=1 Tax=Solanum lycopersicum TaxID=4081 RepID=UPI00374A4AEF
MRRGGEVAGKNHDPPQAPVEGVAMPVNPGGFTDAKIWQDSRSLGGFPIIWGLFNTAFLERFFPREMRKARVEEFVNLMLGSMTVREYSLEFVNLSWYATSIVSSCRNEMIRFLKKLPEICWRSVDLRCSTITGTSPGATAAKPPKRNRFYALKAREEQEKSADVVTCKLQVFSNSTNALLDQSSTLSFITPLLAITFDIFPDVLRDPIVVSTPLGENVKTNRLHKDCPTVVSCKTMSADLVELPMHHFDVILCMDWLHSSYAFMDYHRRVVWSSSGRGKATIVADALRRMRMGSTTHVEDRKKDLVKDVHRLARLGMRLVDSTSGGVSLHPRSESSLVVEVKKGQHFDPVLMELKDLIIEEAHGSTYSIHPGSTKMYPYLKKIYWWDDMNKDIAEYVAKCPNCQKVKTENLKPSGLTQIIERSFQKRLGIQVKLGTAFNLHTDRKVERTIQTLEDMLRACLIDFRGSWDDHVPLIEFSYNNSYHSSIGIVPFEALYSRRCRSPVGWFEVEDSSIFCQEIIHKALEKFRVIRDRLATSYTRQKPYADNRK